ncbi:MAG: peptide chain release factor-like protein [Nitrospirae bacterium]|nr:peptide chain release factor-like protein [Nitrospirota bacterium]MBI3605863.1 peptide chain release factor-like protein [Nitrospirota bacterium]
MLMFPVSPKKEKELLERMEKLGVREADIAESFVRSSGPGGQNVNKTSTSVVLVHLPSGIKVKCQKERSQALNRFVARKILLDKIETEKEGKLSAEQQRIEKIRRQKKRRTRRTKEKLLEDKRLQGEKKRGRTAVKSHSPDD